MANMNTEVISRRFKSNKKEVIEMETEKKYQCPKCKRIITESQFIEEQSSGSGGMCYCGFSAVDENGEVWYPRIFYDMKEVKESEIVYPMTVEAFARSGMCVKCPNQIPGFINAKGTIWASPDSKNVFCEKCMKDNDTKSFLVCGSCGTRMKRTIIIGTEGFECNRCGITVKMVWDPAKSEDCNQP